MGASIWEGSTTIASTANANNSYKSERFAANASHVTTGLFTLTVFVYAVGTGSLDVFINGASQFITIDFTETSPTTVTVPGVELGDIVVIRGLIGGDASQSAAASAAAAAAQAAASAASATAAAASYASILALSLPNLPLSIANGGTGTTTKSAAFLALAPIPVANKVIGSTDGVNFSMVSTGISSVTAITIPTTLTAAILAYHAIAMTSLGGSITLPDATTLNIGGPRAIFDNTKGLYPVGIRNASGVLIGAIAAGGEAFVALKDNSTAAGVWSMTGSNLEPGLVTLDTPLTSTYAGQNFMASLVIDATTSLHFAAVTAGGFSAFVVDSLGNVISTPLYIDPTPGAVPVAAFKVTATTFILFYSVSTIYSGAILLTLTGASPSFGLTAGSGTAAADGLAWANEDLIGAPKLVQLTPNLYFAAYTSSTTARCVAISVAGTAVTNGPLVDTTVATSTANAVAAVALTATTALFLYSVSNAMVARVVTIAGTTCTLAASATSPITSTQTALASFALLSPTKLVVASDASSSTASSVVLTIAGTVVSWGASVTVDSTNAGLTSALIYIGGGATRYVPHLFPLSANTALLWWQDNTSPFGSRTTVLTENAGTVTVGPIFYNTIAYANAIGAGFPSQFGATEFLTAQVTATGGGGYQQIFVANKIAGTAITKGASKYLPIYEPPTTMAMTRISAGKYLISAAAPLNVTTVTGIHVVSTNGDAINYGGSISCAPITIARHIPISATRAVLVGYTKSNPSSAAASQVRVINMEIVS